MGLSLGQREVFSLPRRGSSAAPFLALALALAMVWIGMVSASAQATPEAVSLDVPLPQECKVEPRALPLFPDGVGQREPATPAPLVTEPAPPFTPPSGEAADAETVAGVTATVRETLACRNANQLLSAYALFTQNMVTALFGGPGTIDPEIGAAIETPGEPFPRKARVALVEIHDVTILPDGRVGAVVDTLTIQQAFRDYLVFALDDASGRWLIDGMTPISVTLIAQQ